MAQFKVLILGDSNVGKTAILFRYTKDVFRETHRPTIGVDFTTRVVELEGQPLLLSIMDTAGQERFGSIIRSILRQASGVLLVFDLSSRDTLVNITKWVTEIETNIDPYPPVILVGNKSDLKDIKISEGLIKEVKDNLIKEERIVAYEEVSAKTNENIDEVFLKLAKEMSKQHKSKLLKPEIFTTTEMLSFRSGRISTSLNPKNTSTCPGDGCNTIPVHDDGPHCGVCGRMLCEQYYYRCLDCELLLICKVCEQSDNCSWHSRAHPLLKCKNIEH